MPEHVSGNPQNNRPVKERRGRSTFDLSHYIFGTHRFGQYNVNFVQDCVGKDVIPVRSADDIDSYTLKAPLMQDVQKTKEYFFVPKQCILPINWDKLERQPALGDDVDASKVNDLVHGFNGSVNSVFDFFKNLLAFENNGGDEITTITEVNRIINNYIRRLLFAELWFSDGSLLAATGAHLSRYWRITTDDNIELTFDEYFDNVISVLLSNFASSSSPLSFVSGDKIYTIGDDSLSVGSKKLNIISIHRALELMRDDYSCEFVCNMSFASVKTYCEQAFIADDYSSSVINVNGRGYEVDYIPDSDSHTGGLHDTCVSLDRVAAYQIVCAHYFSNDSIDFIHSADLWRQNMKALWQSFVIVYEGSIAALAPWFDYNGVDTWYDDLSFFVISSLLSYLSTFRDLILAFNLTDSADLAFVGYFINLLGWRRSLRYQDYFTGAKARPLAVGDFSIAVNDGKVDVIDVTKRISAQRLANNVNRIGNSIEKWYKEIMGSELNYDYHNPMWLASTRSTVFAAKSENTAEAQQTQKVSTVANFVGKDSNFEFTMRPDRNGVIIGITYYDIRRAYYTGVERMLQHYDRFDGFIPDMQFIGDQPVYGDELDVVGAGTVVSYQLRNAEYKQKTDQAYGGFVRKLPGFAFLYKPEVFDDGNYFNDSLTISPEFIRSRCDEFDRFYISLSGYSNAHYFHFIVKTFNEVKASRPMIFAPQIL